MLTIDSHEMRDASVRALAYVALAVEFVPEFAPDVFGLL